MVEAQLVYKIKFTYQELELLAIDPKTEISNWATCIKIPMPKEKRDQI